MSGYVQSGSQNIMYSLSTDECYACQSVLDVQEFYNQGYRIIKFHFFIQTLLLGFCIKN